MDLILWRHAEAEEISEDGGDLSRRLTPKGRKQAKAVASWLLANAPKKPRILVSPALRTLETAQALNLEFETCPEIAPSASVNDLLLAAGWPGARNGDKDQTVILVGHQPTLGRVAARLLSGRESNWAIKKGAIWWIQRRNRDDQNETLLRLVLPADLA